MDKISKALKKLTIKEKEIVKAILEKIKNNSISDLDIKKLKGYDNIFRARKGKIRIIFSKVDENNINILTIEKRQDRTYKI